MVSTFFYIIIGILIFNYFFSIFLERLNLKHKPQQLPEIIADIYNNEDYRKQECYEIAKTKLSLFEISASSFIVVVFFSLKGFGILQGIVTNITQSQILQTLLYFGILSFITLII